MALRVTRKGDDGGRVKQLAYLRKHRVRVGVIGADARGQKKRPRRAKGADKRKDPASVGVVAAAHEYGLGVPLRSWLRSPIDARIKDIRKRQQRLARKVVAGKMTADMALERLGLWLTGEIKKAMSAGLPVKPLDQETIDRKRSSKPLIDTGQLRSSITHEVVRK